MTVADPLQATCPVPFAETERVLLGHGSGGQLSAELLRELIVPALDPAGDRAVLEDAAVIQLDGVTAVISTDAFVVKPIVFPGGDIGALAVHGTVNDLAMMGAQPRALTLSLVVEEGLPLEELRHVLRSAGAAATAVGVPIVSGDTKVVNRGAADGLFVTTTGVGVRTPDATPSATRGRPGDVVVLSGPIGLHGTAILSAREGLGFSSDIASDTRPLHRLVQRMVEVGGSAVHTLRDPTRGGVASVLNELAEAAGVGVELDEAALPVPDIVRAACEVLGLDPLHVANEGVLLAFLAPDRADAVVAAMRELTEGAGTAVVGAVVADPPGRVTMRTLLGSRRIVDMLIGEQLPRIC